MGSFEVHGWSGHKLLTKLKMLKGFLKKRNKEFRKIDERIKEAEEVIEQVDKVGAEREPNVEEIARREAQANLWKGHRDEESVEEKSRHQWVKEGVKNKRFFQLVTKEQRMAGLCVDGVWLENSEKVRNATMIFFRVHVYMFQKNASMVASWFGLILIFLFCL